MEQFAPVPVSHTAWCHGLVMKHRDGWSVSYVFFFDGSKITIIYGVGFPGTRSLMTTL